MKPLPAIGFVVPAFNAEGTIGDTLRSLQAQSCGDWSAVVVDDGSSDGTSAIAGSFSDERITVIRQSNAGVASGATRGCG